MHKNSTHFAEPQTRHTPHISMCSSTAASTYVMREIPTQEHTYQQGPHPVSTLQPQGTHSQEGVLHILQDSILRHCVCDLVFGDNDVLLQYLHGVELVRLLVATENNLAKGSLTEHLLHLKVFNSLQRTDRR